MFRVIMLIISKLSLGKSIMPPAQKYKVKPFARTKMLPLSRLFSFLFFFHEIKERLWFEGQIFLK